MLSRDRSQRAGQLVGLLLCIVLVYRADSCCVSISLRPLRDVPSSFVPSYTCYGWNTANGLRAVLVPHLCGTVPYSNFACEFGECARPTRPLLGACGNACFFLYRILVAGLPADNQSLPSVGVRVQQNLLPDRQHDAPQRPARLPVEPAAADRGRGTAPLSLGKAEPRCYPS